MWDNRYRQLKMGEIVQVGDEIFCDDHPWHGGNERWEKVPASQIGQAAPDPRYVSHRRFRRLIQTPPHITITNPVKSWVCGCGKKECHYCYSSGKGGAA